MEKFGVDLDKVLDEFEFNEEQAVRNTPYIHEELPAKKYQRPSFQRINLADADFSPSKQTTAPPIFDYSPPELSNPFVPSPLLSNIDTVPNSKIAIHNGNVEETNEAVLVATSDESDSELMPDSADECKPEAGAIPDLLGNDILGIGSLNLPDLTETGQENGHEPDVVGSNSIPTHQLIELQPNDESQNGCHPVSIENLMGCNEEENNIECNASYSNGINSDLSSDAIINGIGPIQDLSNISEDIIADNISTSQEIAEENENSINLNSDELCDIQVSNVLTVIEPDVDVCDDLAKSEIEEGIVIDDVVEPDELVERPTEDCVPEESTVEPIRYVEETDISEQDLELYLERLEAEQNELELQPDVQIKLDDENLIVETTEEVVSEEAPQRPNSLDLNSATIAQQPIGTPIAASGENPSGDQENGLSESDETENVPNNVEQQKDETNVIISEETSADSASEPMAGSLVALTVEERRLGKVTPFWVPDADAMNCMECDAKFTVLKRRHHCRACGRVLCIKCCDMRAAMEYLRNQEHRVCELCFRTLTKVMMYEETDSEVENSPRRRPNPNNPMEYCSTVPPPLQASPSSSQAPPSVLVPVLKREGATRARDPQRKVIFSDGIRPGGDLTELDEPPPPRVQKLPHAPKRVGTPPGSVGPSPVRMQPAIDPTSQSFILEQCLPPLCAYPRAGKLTYLDPLSKKEIMERLTDPEQQPLLFALNRHLLVSLKIVNKDCCIGQTCWVFTTHGMAAVCQDEIVILLQISAENEPIPVEIFMQLHYIYQSAELGSNVGELGYWSVKQSTFLDSRQHGGFLFIRPTFQCVQKLESPRPPYLIGVLIHRLELPWARQFPLRLMLRLGAEFKYYPCSFVSVRHREPVYYEIGQTFMKFLADFRDYTFTLPAVSGLKIHMEAQQTSVLIPRNRYDQVVRALNNSNDPVLALAGSFSSQADAHLVCMQSKGEDGTYSTHAINIYKKVRNVTGASFVVFSASLKATGNIQGKSKILEDGLMVEISADSMVALRGKLRACEDWSVRCGPNGEELIQVAWCDDDRNFNIGVQSGIDKTPLDGVPSIRVHGSSYPSGVRFIRWTEVFIIKCEDGTTSVKIGDPLDVKRLSENIARATCSALTKSDLLDLLATARITCLSLRATISPEVVCYEVGSSGEKLPSTYMKSLDNELIPVLHKATSSTNDATAILELIFHILEQ